jgi:hypothetical protein
MEALFSLLEKNEILIYAILGTIGFFVVRQMILQWNEWRNAVFGMEKENAQRKFSTTLTIATLLILLVLAEFSIVSFVIPIYPHGGVLATPTIQVLTTPTQELGSTPDQAVPVSPETTPVMAMTAAVALEGCIQSVVEWSSPVPGEKISGTWELRGTVNVPDLGFYKYEYAPAGSDEWVTIAAGNQNVSDDILGNWNTGQLDPGDYRLRLVVADSQNQALPACVVDVRIIAP